MAISPDGILEATFDPSRAAVFLTVDGGMWPDVADRITLRRTPVGQPTVEVRGVVNLRVVGGWYIGTDHEMPLDVDVTYTVTGYYADGAEIATATVTVSTVGAVWGVWLKAPGRGDLTALAQLRDRGDVASSTLGGTFQVHDGPEVAAYSGVGGDRIGLQLQTRTTAQDAALRRLLKESRRLLVQTGQPADIGDGTGSDWWFVESYSQTNPQQYVPSGGYALRYHALQLVRTTVPAGEGVVYTGQTYSTVYGQFATYQALLNGTATYQDLMTGGS